MSNDPNRPKRLKKLADDIADSYDDIQRKMTEKAKEAGYSRDIFSEVGSSLENIPDDPLLEVTESSLKNFHNFISTKKSQFNQFTDISSSAFTVASTAAVSGNIVYMNKDIYKTIDSKLPGVPIPAPPSSWTPKRNENYAKCFDKLDPELGKTYRSVWEIFHGTKDSPERLALFAMRQVFDQFFRLLAPDEKVRESEFFKEKKGDKPRQVHRKERIRYAANTHIGNKTLANTLVSQETHVIEVYDRLNKAHTDKPLDRNLVKDILISMQGVLEEWIDALEIAKKPR
jgi:hypothetical protein